MILIVTISVTEQLILRFESEKSELRFVIHQTIAISKANNEIVLQVITK